jgi:hypothetical protein
VREAVCVSALAGTPLRRISAHQDRNYYFKKIQVLFSSCDQNSNNYSFILRKKTAGRKNNGNLGRIS